MNRNKESPEEIALFEKLAAEFCKYDRVINKKPKTLTAQIQQVSAYKKMAEECGLSNIENVKKEITNMKKYVNCKMRRCVRLSIINGGGRHDAFNYAPEWFKQLDKPLNLLQTARKVETLNSLKYYRAGRRVSLFTWELMRSARRAAARDLQALGPEDAARTLAGEEAVREYAEAMDMNVNKFHEIWIRSYAQSMYKLRALIEVGDCSDNLGRSERLSQQEWQVVDIGLLYDTCLRVVDEQKSFQSSHTLNPLILLFKLMIAAHEKLNQGKAPTHKKPHAGCQSEKVGAQSGTDNPESQIACDAAIESEKEDECRLKSERDRKGPDEYETAEIWAMVHTNYTNRSRSASALLLQRRWHELKELTRRQLTRAAPTPTPILLALAKRFPYILTEELPPWWCLVKNKKAYQESDLEAYKRMHAATYLDVPNYIHEELLFDELYDWSDDEIEVINDVKETITVSDSDDERTDKKTAMKRKLSEADDRVIEKLERIDPAASKVKIIFEDDSDSDLNEYLNSENDETVDSKNLDTNQAIAATDKLSKANEIPVSNVDDCSERHFDMNFYEAKPDSIVKSEFGANISTDSLVNVQNDQIASSIYNSHSENSIFPHNGQDKIDIKQNYFNTTELSDNMPNLDANMKTEGFNDLNLDNSSDIDCERSESRLTIDTDVIDTDEEQIGDRCAGDECGGDDDGANDELVERPLVDEKLIKLSHVVLTPIELLSEWKLFSRDGILNCRRFSVRNFSKPVAIASRDLSKCRPYAPRRRPSFSNGISQEKNLDLWRIPQRLKRKRRMLIQRLKLSRTAHSARFWSERNVQLLQLCKPASVLLHRIARVVKKIELADIAEVRRINSTILTAQVAPITVEANRAPVIEPPSISPPKTAYVQDMTQGNHIVATYLVPPTPTWAPPHAAPTTPTTPTIPTIPTIPTTPTIPTIPTTPTIPTMPTIPTIPTIPTTPTTPTIPTTPTSPTFIFTYPPHLQNSLIRDNVVSDPDAGAGSENIENKQILNEGEVKDLIKMIVRKRTLPKLPPRSGPIEVTVDLSFANKQKELEKDIRDISKGLLERIDMTRRSRPRCYKKKTKQVEQAPAALTSLEEWQRQKMQNLKYFNFLNVTDEVKNDKKPDGKDKKAKKDGGSKKCGRKSEKDSSTVGDDVSTNDAAIDLTAATAKSATKTLANATTESVAKSITESVAKSPTDSIAKPTTKSVAKFATNSVAKPTNKSVANPATESVVNSTTGSLVNLTTGSLAHSTTESVVIATTKSVVNSTTKSVVNSTTKSLVNSTFESTANSTTVSVANPTTDSIAYPIFFTVPIVKPVDYVNNQANTYAELQKSFQEVYTNALKRTRTEPKIKTESDVIDLCDSDEEALRSTSTDAFNNVYNRNRNTNEANKPQINIKIVQNMIEINSACAGGPSEPRNADLLNFLSKVAGRIQEQNVTAPVPNTGNSKVYYVIKNNAMNVVETVSIENAEAPNRIDAHASNPMFYVVKVPDPVNGVTGSVLTPIVDNPPLPVAQNVAALNQGGQGYQRSNENLHFNVLNQGHLSGGNALVRPTINPLLASNSLIDQNALIPFQNVIKNQKILQQNLQQFPNQQVHALQNLFKPPEVCTPTISVNLPGNQNRGQNCTINPTIPTITVNLPETNLNPVQNSINQPLVQNMPTQFPNDGKEKLNANKNAFETEATKCMPPTKPVAIAPILAHGLKCNKKNSEKKSKNVPNTSIQTQDTKYQSKKPAGNAQKPPKTNVPKAVDLAEIPPKVKSEKDKRPPKKCPPKKPKKEQLLKQTNPSNPINRIRKMLKERLNNCTNSKKQAKDTKDLSKKIGPESIEVRDKLGLSMADIMIGPEIKSTEIKDIVTPLVKDIDKRIDTQDKPIGIKDEICPLVNDIDAQVKSIDAKDLSSWVETNIKVKIEKESINEPNDCPSTTDFFKKCDSLKNLEQMWNSSSDQRTPNTIPQPNQRKFPRTGYAIKQTAKSSLKTFQEGIEKKRAESSRHMEGMEKKKALEARHCVPKLPEQRAALGPYRGTKSISASLKEELAPLTTPPCETPEDNINTNKRSYVNDTFS